jgi:hypothetical protein
MDAPPGSGEVVENPLSSPRGSGLTVARMSSPTAWMALSDVDSAQVDEILELVQSATEVTNRDFVSFYRDDDDWPRIVDQGWAEEDRSGPRP